MNIAPLTRQELNDIACSLLLLMAHIQTNMSNTTDAGVLEWQRERIRLVDDQFLRLADLCFHMAAEESES